MALGARPGMNTPAGSHWLNSKRLTVYSLAFISVYLFLGVYLILKFKHGVDPQGIPLGCDFIVFWGASHLALAGQAAGVYDPHLLLVAEKAALPGIGFATASPWQYPPMFLLLVLPLALLPYFAALVLYLAGTAWLYVSVVGKILPRPEVLLPLLAFPAVFINTGGGQNGFLTTALISGALLLLQSRPALAGVLIGLLTIKPQLGLLLPLALVSGRYWRTLFFACVTAATFLMVSLAVLGVDTLDAFLSRLPVVAGWLSDGILPLKKMPTVFALLRLLDAPAAVAYAVQGAVALGVAAAVILVWLRRGDASLRAAALIVGSLLVSPYLYDYDLVWLAPALAWFTEYALRRGWRRGEREMLVAAWLLPGVVLLLYNTLHVQLASLVLLAFFVMIVRRALGDALPGQAQQPGRTWSGRATAGRAGLLSRHRSA